MSGSLHSLAFPSSTSSTVFDPEAQTEGSSPTTTSITVQPLAPSFGFPFGTSITMPENSVFQSPVTAPFVDLSDYGGSAENVTMSVSHGAIDLTNTTGVTVTGNGTASVNLIGSIGNINNALYTLDYYPTTNYVGTDTLNFSDTGTTTHLTGTASATITIVGFTVAAPASASVTENTALTFSSASGNEITVTDAFPGNTSDSLIVSVSDGTVTLGSTSGLTFTGGANGSGTFTVSGTIGNLNADLNGVTYQPNNNYTGSDS